jgi:hypothetical protein
MSEKRIIITIEQDGKIVAKTDGFKGETCLEALEALLGADTHLSKLSTTDEYNQRIQSKNSQNIKNNRS